MHFALILNLDSGLGFGSDSDLDFGLSLVPDPNLVLVLGLDLSLDLVPVLNQSFHRHYLTLYLLDEVFWCLSRNLIVFILVLLDLDHLVEIHFLSRFGEEEED